jgi:hypothetical protein
MTNFAQALRSRNNILKFLLLSFLLFGFILLIIPNSNSNSFETKPESLIKNPYVASISEYSGTGITNNVAEYGEGYFQNYGIELWNLDKADITIPEFWQGNNLLVNVSNIREYNKYWVNDTFTSGYDTKYWSSEVLENDNPITSYNNYIEFSHSPNEESLYITLTNGSQNTYKQVDAYWNYSFYLDREKISYQDWTVDFDYKVIFDDSNWLTGVTGGSSYYTQIIVDGVSSDIFKMRNYNSVTNDTSYSSALTPFSPEQYNFLPPGRVDLLIGVDFANV